MPFVVVSPYTRCHFVSHVIHEHTVILRFIETRFDLPGLTRRDANANPLLEFFDFRHARVHLRISRPPLSTPRGRPNAAPRERPSTAGLKPT